MIEQRFSTDYGGTFTEWRERRTARSSSTPISTMFEQPDITLIRTEWEDGNVIEYRRA